MTFNFFSKTKKRGFFILTLVLLVSVTVLAISVGVLLRSLSEVNESADSEMSLKAWSVVNACGEYALGQLASTTETPGWSYAGNYSLPVGTEACYIYGVEDGLSGTKIIKASSTVSYFTRKILIEVATNTPSLIVSSWHQVADF